MQRRICSVLLIGSLWSCASAGADLLTEITERADAISHTVGPIARCDLALSLADDSVANYPMQIRANILVREFEAQTQHQFPNIMAAQNFLDLDLMKRLEGYKDGKILAQLMTRDRLTGHFDTMIKLARAASPKASVGAGVELRRDVFRHLFRRSLDELLNNPSDEGHFIGLYTVARTFEREPGEFTRFAKELLAFRFAYSTEIHSSTASRERPPVNQIQVLGQLLQDQSLLKAVTLDAFELVRDHLKKDGRAEYFQKLGRFCQNVDGLADLAKTMKAHQLAWTSVNIDVEEINDTLKHVRDAWQILSDVSVRKMDLQIPAAMARAGQLTVAWFNPIARVLRDRPTLAASPDFVELMKDATFADFANAVLLRRLPAPFHP